jgi:hypothetical protein
LSQLPLQLPQNSGASGEGKSNLKAAGSNPLLAIRTAGIAPQPAKKFEGKDQME